MSDSPEGQGLCRFQIRRDRDGRYRWYLFNANGTMIAKHRGGFETEEDARLDAEQSRELIAKAPIIGAPDEKGLTGWHPAGASTQPTAMTSRALHGLVTLSTFARVDSSEGKRYAIAGDREAHPRRVHSERVTSLIALAVPGRSSSRDPST